MSGWRPRGGAPRPSGAASCYHAAVMNRALWTLALALVVGCESEEPNSPAPIAPPAVSSAALPPPPPPTPRKPVTFASKDGASLAGDLYLSTDASAPVAVLVHRLSADRGEMEPLAKRLSLAPKRFTVLNFDLRAHGASKPPEKAKLGDTKDMAKDVDAAIAHALEATGGKARGVVLVGSSLGATLASEVAFSQPKVTALALISPGAAISGHDLYKPYAEVRNLPTFIAGAQEDTVSREPLGSLEKMAMSGTVKRYEGSRHSAGHIADEHAELWSDLEAWLLGVFDAQLVPRVSLYRAAEKEPVKPKVKGSGRPAGAR